MGGKPCVRGMRGNRWNDCRVGGLGSLIQRILAAYPYLEDEDIRQALAYAAWRVEEIEVPLPAA
jgi:uncharacterized protein (DUF433 family)